MENGESSGAEGEHNPHITLSYVPGTFEPEIVDSVSLELSRFGTVSVSDRLHFSEGPHVLTLFFDLLFSTLTGIGANALYDALKAARQSAKASSNRLVLRARLYVPESVGEPSRVLDTFIDVDDAVTFGRAVNSVNRLLRENGQLFVYDADRDEWEDISQGRKEKP